MKTQRGAAMVEFAIIALLFFMLLFGIIEFGRAWFTYNTLVEATRRGARVAAVCPPGGSGIDIDNSKTKIENTVLFKSNQPLDTSNTPGFLGLTRENIQIEYFNRTMTPWNYDAVSKDGVVVGNIDDSEDVPGIAFVRVSIINFQHTLIISLVGDTLFSPRLLETTLPAESLGRTTPDNPLAANARQCIFP